MDRTITFNELRKIKDLLPSGSMKQIAGKTPILMKRRSETISEGETLRKDSVLEFILNKDQMVA